MAALPRRDAGTGIGTVRLVERFLVACAVAREVEVELPLPVLGVRAARPARAGGSIPHQFLAAVEDLCPAAEPLAPGVCIFPVRLARRAFGGEESLGRAILQRVRELPDLSPMHAARGVGIADGVLAACIAAHLSAGRLPGWPLRGEVGTVASGQTPEFLAPFPLELLVYPELADLLGRVGIHTLGQLACLPRDRLVERFGHLAASYQDLASGLSDRPIPPTGHTRDRTASDRSASDAMQPPETPGAVGIDRAQMSTRYVQPGFWGEVRDGTGEMSRAVEALETLLGEGTVLMAHILGGRSPAERAMFVPWASYEPRGGQHEKPLPWPGRIPPPSPSLVFDPPIAADLLDARGERAEVTARGILRADPAQVSIGGSPLVLVAGWAGPWPADEHWWSAPRRRRARVQLLTAEGDAHLLVVERGRWFCEGTYD